MVKAAKMTKVVTSEEPPLICKFDLWPPADQAAWALNLTPGDPFDDPHYGHSLRIDSQKKAAKGYGRWLAFLASRDWLDPDMPALARVTVPRLRAYFRTLQKGDNAGYTIINRFSELVMAMKILAPGVDVSWIRKPDGVTIYAMLRKVKRVLLVPHSDVLFQWGLDMMDAAQLNAPRRQGLVAYRDGLMIALLASRGRRLRSMSLMRAYQELFAHNNGYRIEFTADQIKTNRPDHFNLPHRMTPYLTRYLDVVRPALLRGADLPDVWIGINGKRLTAKGIQNRILLLSKQRFGVAFGPHRFRHAIGTTAPLHDPTNPGLAAGVLGISKAVVEAHYNRGGQIEAATKWANAIEARRRELAQVLRLGARY